MRKIAAWVLVLGMAMSPAAMAADGNDKTSDTKTDASSTNSTNTAKTNAPAPSSTELEAEIEQLRALIKEQADQLAAMKAAMPNAAATTSATASGSTSATMATPAVMTTASATPSVAAPAVAASAAAATPAQDVEDSPLQFRIGGATIQPIGFVDFTTVWRSHDGGSGIGTNFAGIPYGNNFQDNLSEFRFSMQNSRIGFRVDATVKGAHVIGYMESDFLGNNPGNVGVSSNSNTLRSRLYWVDVRKDKWEVLGGQTWSLITPGRSGISPLPGDLFYTQNIDVNYQLGLTWGRIPEARVVYHPTDKVAVAVALDSPEQYIGGSAGGPLITCPAGLAATVCGTGTAIQFNNGATTLNSPNRAPDVIGKIAFDPTSRMHFEAGGLERQFADFNTATSAKFSKTGVGAFANFNVELFKGFRFISNNYWSSGGGRYIFGQVPDVIIRNDGSISPIRNGSTVSGFEFTHHNTLLYAYYGGVYVARNTAFDTNGTTPIGYGAIGAAGSTGQNRSAQEATFGFNQTIWKDAKYGALNFMGQYSYLTRDPWFVVTGQPANAHVNLVFLNLRYTLPGSAPTQKK
jgi:hypothetical protein